MSKPTFKLRTARQIVARSAESASPVLALCVKSEWLSSATQARPNYEATDIAKLAVSLFLAHQQYVQNGKTLREMRAGDRDYRAQLRQSMKLLKEAEKTAGLFANALASIRAGMNSEVTKTPLFDAHALRGKGSTASPESRAQTTAAALLEQFCPKKIVDDPQLARQIKRQADELLRAIGFGVKLRRGGQATP